ncbi:MAG TPA: DUF1127 domain-containing protein [Terriglobales bacterium]|nr:DUF1127 domain-containing protein [Terriglobales bacterium]
MAEIYDAKGWRLACAFRGIVHARNSNTLPLLLPVGRFWRWLRNYRARLSSLRALRQLSDRELRDIGIERHQLGAVIDRLQRRREVEIWRRYHPWQRHDK